jgi:hypothetical protein
VIRRRGLDTDMEDEIGVGVLARCVARGSEITACEVR